MARKTTQDCWNKRENQEKKYIYVKKIILRKYLVALKAGKIQELYSVMSD